MELFQQYFKTHARYTAGVETRYAPSMITGTTQHQDLAKGFVVGTRFHSAPVIRLADARPMQLGHTVKADGRWRIVAFGTARDTGAPGGPVAELCAALTAPSSILDQVTPDGADIDSVIETLAVFQVPHREIELQNLPRLLLPIKGKLKLTDYEKVFCPCVEAPNIFDLRGVNRAQGAAVVIRPDQYISQVCPLDAADTLGGFFRGVLRFARIDCK